MERPSGLGRSLEDVLDSLTPADPDPTTPGRVLFEPEDLEQQLDSLMGEIRELRERVQHLVALVPGDADEATPTRRGKSHAKAKKGKRKAGDKTAIKHVKKMKIKKPKKVGKGAKSKSAKTRPHREAA